MAVSQSSVLKAVRDGVPAGDRCPWCEQSISHEKFEEIRARITAREQERTAQLRRELAQELARERAKIEAKANAGVERARKEADAAIAQAAKKAAEKESGIRAEAKRAAEVALAPRLTEAEKGKKEAERQLRALEATQEALLDQRLRQQREALEKAKSDAVNTEKSKAFKDKLKLEGKLQALQRQMQQKSAGERGEGAEIDLFEALKAEFPEDRITRVNKGAPGADILHEVVHKGRVCGTLIYDSKDRGAWRNDYVTKVRQDQIAAKADHSILSSPVLPAGTHQIHIQDEVIIVNPARALVIVEMLRKHLIQTSTLRLSNESRNEKREGLYRFITSERCSQLLGQIETLTDDMLELDVKEKKTHDTTWSKRGALLKSVQRARGTFATEIERIIGTSIEVETTSL